MAPCTTGRATGQAAVRPPHECNRASKAIVLGYAADQIWGRVHHLLGIRNMVFQDLPGIDFPLPGIIPWFRRRWAPQDESFRIVQMGVHIVIDNLLEDCMYIPSTLNPRIPTILIRAWTSSGCHLLLVGHSFRLETNANKTKHYRSRIRSETEIICSAIQASLGPRRHSMANPRGRRTPKGSFHRT